MMTNLELRMSLRERKQRWEIIQASWIDSLGMVVPMAAPLVPAFLTFTAILAHYPDLLNINWWWILLIAIVAAAVIELLGILSIETMFDMRTYNATLQADEESAPFEYAAAAVGFYLALVMSLVMLLKIWPAFALWSLAPLTVLGFVTSWVMVLRKQHSERVFNREEKKMKGVNEEIAQRDTMLASLDVEIRTLRRTVSSLEIDLDNANIAKLEVERLAEGLTKVLADKEIEAKLLTVELDGLRRQVDMLSKQQVIAPTGVSEPAKPPQKTGSTQTRRIEILKVLTQTQQKADVNFTELGRTFGTSDTTIKKDLQWLIENEYWQNGDTWKPTTAGLGLIG